MSDKQTGVFQETLLLSFTNDINPLQYDFGVFCQRSNALILRISNKLYNILSLAKSPGDAVSIFENESINW